MGCSVTLSDWRDPNNGCILDWSLPLGVSRPRSSCVVPAATSTFCRLTSTEAGYPCAYLDRKMTWLQVGEAYPGVALIMEMRNKIEPVEKFFCLSLRQ